MFREVARVKQQLSAAECAQILKTEKRGVLSVLGDEGYPYGMPMNHWYCEEDGKLYFHSGLKGHRSDAMKACDKASFCVYDAGYRREGEWALNIRSVIVFGRLQVVEDEEKALEFIRRLSDKFTDDTAYVEREIREAMDHTLIFTLTPEHITGKLVNEA